MNETDEKTAKLRLAEYIKEYAEEFYSDYAYWSKAPNRQSHIPYVFKALTLDTESVMEDMHHFINNLREDEFDQNSLKTYRVTSDQVVSRLVSVFEA